MLDREGKRSAKAAGKAPVQALAPFQVQETADGFAVVFEPASGESVRNFEPVPFTGPDSLEQAESQARVLNGQALAMRS